MNWKGHEIAFRLKSPLHVGSGESGNLLASRSYVTGRTFWGALTARLTRDSMSSPDAEDYRHTGTLINQKMAFTYFYPAVHKNGNYDAIWPWSGTAADATRGSYAATALSHKHGAAEMGALYEVEYIAPFLPESSEPVYLYGYIFSTDGAPAWQDTLSRLQLGSERGYGWGRVVLETCKVIPAGGPTPLFQGMATVDLSAPYDRPLLSLPACGQNPGRLLAHTFPMDTEVRGEVEPLVTREWESGECNTSGPGRQVNYHGVFHKPGSKISSSRQFFIGENALWVPVSNTDNPSGL